MCVQAHTITSSLERDMNSPAAQQHSSTLTVVNSRLLMISVSRPAAGRDGAHTQLFGLRPSNAVMQGVGKLNGRQRGMGHGQLGLTHAC